MAMVRGPPRRELLENKRLRRITHAAMSEFRKLEKALDECETELAHAGNATCRTG